MARPENPVSRGNGPLSEFALALRKLRQQAGGISYRELSRRSYCSASALSEAASANRLPTWGVTKAYVEACGGDIREWRNRWEAAKNANAQPWSVADWQKINVRRARNLAENKRMAVDSRHATWQSAGDSAVPQRPNPQAINTIPHLVDSMNRLHIWHGKPSLRTLAKKSSTFAASTLSDALRNRNRMPSFKLVVAFAEACGESPDLVEQWRDAWRRVALAMQAGS
jgi:transcriptional regulator with XRE-family HTH domain